MKLTDKQKEFLGYVSQYTEEWGQSPTFEEICSHFGFNSYNTVTTYLKILERKGYIRLPKKNQKRSIEVTSPVETRRFEFPLLGRVAAGKPIEAVKKGLAEVWQEIGDEMEILGVGTTGSGRHLIGELVGADIIKNEITLFYDGLIKRYPEFKEAPLFVITGSSAEFLIRNSLRFLGYKNIKSYKPLVGIPDSVSTSAFAVAGAFYFKKIHLK